jgi:hypothetical protein
LLGFSSPEILATSTILVLADARFGFYLCFFCGGNLFRGIDHPPFFAIMRFWRMPALSGMKPGTAQ